MKTTLLNNDSNIKTDYEKESPIYDSKDFKIYWKLFKPFFLPKGIYNQLRTFLNYLFLILSKLCIALSPLFLNYILSNLSDYNYSNAVYYLMIMVGLRLTGMILSEMQGYVYNDVMRVALIQISKETYQHITYLSYQWHLEKKMGAVLRSMDRGIQSCDTIVRMIIIRLIMIIFESLIYILSIISILHSLYVGISLFIGLCSYFIVTYYITIWRRKFKENMNNSDNQFHQRYTDALKNYESVKYMASEQYELDMFNQDIKSYYEQNKYVSNSLNILKTIQYVIINTTVIIALCITAFNIIYSQSDIHSFVTIQLMIFQAFQPIQQLGMFLNTFVNGFVNVFNLIQILKVEKKIEDKTNAIEIDLRHGFNGGYIEFNNVCFAYNQENIECKNKVFIEPGYSGINDNYSLSFSESYVNKNSVISENVFINENNDNNNEESDKNSSTYSINDVSFRVKEGESCALVGETGSGKSTIIKLLYRFYDIQSGSILVNGINIKDCTQKSLRSNLGIVPQDTSLFNSTLIYNLTYGSYFIETFNDLCENIEAYARVMKACSNAKLMDFIDRQKEGFDVKVGERGLRLSGGEKQRVSIARCLIRDPAIIVLDEATSSLDNITEKQIQESLDSLKGKTTFVVAHRLTTIMNSNIIIVMGNGKVVESGNHDYLLSLKGKYYDMWKNQCLEKLNE